MYDGKLNSSYIYFQKKLFANLSKEFFHNKFLIKVIYISESILFAKGDN